MPSTRGSVIGSPVEATARWAVLALFIVLALIHTWPIASAPDELGRNSSADTQLNAWTMAWVAGIMSGNLRIYNLKR
jgi:hypothetical protein